MEDNMHVKVSFRVVQKWAAVRKAYRRAMWAHAHSSMDGSDFYWVESMWYAVQQARASVR